MSFAKDYRIYICNSANSKNEDRFSETSLITQRSNATIVGVYDGHGGSSCVEYISNILPSTLAHKLSHDESKSTAEHLAACFSDIDKSLIESLRERFKLLLTIPMPGSVRQKLIDAKLQNDVPKEAALRARSGSTALIAVIEDDCITFANVGDCRAVLGHSISPTGELKAEAMTVDQNGDNQMAQTRICNEHPAAEAQTLFAGGRLFGHNSVTRSFGDVFYKEPNTSYAEYVFSSSDITRSDQLPFKESMRRFYPLIKTPPYLTASPEITIHRRSNHDRFVIIASDGVWGLKSMTKELAVKMVQEGIDTSLDPSEYMMEEFKKLHPGDDVTITVITFS